jgi:hypothetical protein
MLRVPLHAASEAAAYAGAKSVHVVKGQGESRICCGLAALNHEDTIARGAVSDAAGLGVIGTARALHGAFGL